MKEKAAISQWKIACQLENTILFVFVASKSSLLVEQFQLEYNQLPERLLKPPLNKPPCKNQKINKPWGLIQGLTAFQYHNMQLKTWPMTNSSGTKQETYTLFLIRKPSFCMSLNFLNFSWNWV